MKRKKEFEALASFLEDEYRKLNISEETFKKALGVFKNLKGGKPGRRG